MGELHCDHLYQTNTLRKNDQTQTDLTLRTFSSVYIFRKKNEKRKKGCTIRQNNVIPDTSIINVSN